MSYFSAGCGEAQFDERIVPLLDSATRGGEGGDTGSQVLPGARSLAALERRFRTGSTQVRMAVLDALETIANEDILPLLVEAVDHPDPAGPNEGGGGDLSAEQPSRHAPSPAR